MITDMFPGTLWMNALSWLLTGSCHLRSLLVMMVGQASWHVNVLHTCTLQLELG